MRGARSELALVRVRQGLKQADVPGGGYRELPPSTRYLAGADGKHAPPENQVSA